MILLIAIILFIIFLIYSIKPRSEEYILGGLKLSWKNKMGIEGVVDKWIVILKDKSGTTIHEYENSDAGKRKNYTDVTMNIVNNKEFDDRIIGDNTLELYYNDIKPDTKLYTKPLTFTENDFGYIIDMSKLEEFDAPETESYTYEFIINKLTAVLGLHVEYIKLDGVLATKAQTTIHKSPNRNNKPDNMFSIGSGTENYASWNSNGYSVGDKIFTIKSDKKVDKIDIVYMRPRYAPGWIIKENGVTKITETSNRGRNMDPRPVVYTYDIKNGKIDTSKLEEIDAPEPEPEPVNVDKMTNYSINRSENIYMDRQKLDCEGRAMRGFQLQTKWNCEDDDVCKKQVSSADLNATDIKPGGKGAGIRYKYSCSDKKKEKVIFSKETSWVTNPGLSKTFAYGQNDKLNVNCDKKPITYYRLLTDSNNNWRLKYDYKCGNTTSNNCRSITTQESEASNNPAFLDRQTVKCEDDEYLSQFKLISTGVGGTNKYQYTCCK